MTLAKQANVASGDMLVNRSELKALGPEVVKGLRFVCSDMWKPYLQVNGEEPIMRRKVLEGNKEAASDISCSA
jgi:hypothetical protein